MQKTVNSGNHVLVLFDPLIGPLSGATTPCLSGPGSDGNEGVPRIPKSSSITGTSPSNFLCHIEDTRFGVSYPSAEKQTVFSTAPPNWANV